jgi:inorganic phosphate transporter, PiT family
MDGAAFGLFALAGAFALVNGVNDGGALVAGGLKIQTLGVGAAVGLLALAVAVVPLVLGTRVADTLAGRLVVMQGPSGQRALAVAVFSAVLVVVVLARVGLPTSLTLATIGGITGSGLGAGQAVSWGTVGTVLVLAALAPLVGAGIAFGLARSLQRAPAAAPVGRIIGVGHRAAFTLQCVAYGANDGQKMLAVAVLAIGLTGVVGPSLPALAATLALLFLVGTLIGVRLMARTIGGGVLPVRPLNAVMAEFGAGTAVLGSAFLGAPVSMTQAFAGALVGTGVSEGPRRVRWRLVLHIAGAWMVTLPAALIAAGILASLVEAVR